MVQVFISEGILSGKNLQDAIRIAAAVTTEGECIAAYVAGASLMRSGKYEQGRDLVLPVLDACYNVAVRFWNEPEQLRTIVAGEVSLHAGGAGDYGTVLTVEKKLEKDLLTDRLLVRDAKGILQGRTRMGDILRFHKARAYNTAKMPNEAKETLKELQFASGKVFVDGEVVGLRDAVAKLQRQVEGLARLFLSLLNAA